MQKIFELSPRTRFCQNAGGFGNDQAVLVMGLQQKLEDLEKKYSSFVEKCSGLLRIRQSAGKNRYRTYDSDFRLLDESNREGRGHRILRNLNDIENGTLLRGVMEKISDVVMKTQDNLAKYNRNNEKFKRNLSEHLNSMLGNIWEILFENENTVQNILKIHAKDQESGESPSNCRNSPNSDQFYQAKLKTSIEKNAFLTKKLNEQYEFLQKVQHDHNSLKRKLLNMEKSAASIISKPSFDLIKPFGTRSLNTSPNPNSEKIEELKIRNFELENTLSHLAKQNSVLQLICKRSSSCSDYNPDGFQMEKKEIQEQLKALQKKLLGFEKIAKNLIDSSIRTELSILDKSSVKKNVKKKGNVVESPELSLMNSHCSLLEIDQMQKTLEGLEKDKKILELELRNESQKGKTVGLQLENLVKEAREQLRESNEKCESLEKECNETKNCLEKMKKKGVENEKIMEKMESLVLEFEKKLEIKGEQVKECEKQIENMKHLSKVVSEKNKELKKILKENREEKMKILKLNAKHSKNVSNLETTVDEITGKMFGLQAELERTKNSEEERANLIKKLENVEKEREKERTDKEEIEEKYADLGTKLKNTEKSLEETRKDLIIANECKFEMEEILGEKNEKINAFEANKTQIPELTLELLEKNKSYLKLEKELLKKSKEIEEILKNAQEYQEKIEDLTIKNSENFEKINGLMNAKAKIVIEHNKTLKEKSALCASVDELNEKISDLEELVEKAKKSDEKSEKELEKFRGKCTLLEEKLRKSKEDARNEKTTIEEEIKRAEMILKQRNKEILIFQKDKTQVEKEFGAKIEELEKIREGCQGKIEELERKIKKNIKIEEKLLKEIKEKQVVFESQTEKNGFLNEEILRLQSQVDELHQQIDKNVEESNLKDEKIEELICEIERTCKNQPHLEISHPNSMHILKYSRITDELLIKLAKSKAKQLSFKSTNSNLLQKLLDSENLLKKASESEKELQKSLKVLKTLQSSPVLHQISLIKSDFLKLKSEFSKNFESFTDFIPGLLLIKTSVSSFQAKISNLQKKVEDSKGSPIEKKNLQMSLEAKNIKIEELLLENSSIKGQILCEEAKISKFAFEEKSFSQKKVELENELLIRDKKIVDLTVELSKYDKNLEELENISEKNKQIIKLTEKISEMEDKILDLNELRHKIMINKQEFLQMDANNQELFSQIQEKDKLLESLSSSSQKFKLESEKLSKECEILNETNKLIKVELAANEKIFEAELASIKSVLKSEKSSKSELEKVLAAKETTELDLQLKIFHKSEEVEKLKQELLKRSDTLVPVVTKHKNNSSGAREISKTVSEYVEGTNISACKILKKVNAANKNWVLLQSDSGTFNWKEDAEFVFGSDLQDEDIEECKVALGTWYTGSVLEAIEALKSQVEISFDCKEQFNYPQAQKIDFDTNSFRGEMLQSGLEISVIGDCDDIDEYEKMQKNLSLKEAKLEKKKRMLLLHKEQIALLKETLRKNSEEIRNYQGNIKDLEKRLESAMGVNLQYLKQVFSNLVVKLQVDKNIEDLVILVFKILDFHIDEVEHLQQQRKGSKKLIKK